MSPAALAALHAIYELHPLERDNVREAIAAEVVAAEDFPLRRFDTPELLDELRLRYHTGGAELIDKFVSEILADKSKAAQDRNPEPLE
jgi:hypothetical protein